MAHIQELMAAGTAWQLARMLGSNRLKTVMATGVGQDTAAPLNVNYCAVVAGGDGIEGPPLGVRLGFANAGALTAIFNLGPAAILVYPAEDDTINDLGPNEPLTVPPGNLWLGVPSVNQWLALSAPADGGAIGDAPANGVLYGRQNGQWAPASPPIPPPAMLWIDAGPGQVIPAGTVRVYVTTTDLVTLTLPLNDCLVLDQSGNRTSNPIVVNPPTGTINGLSSYAMVNPWQAASFLFDGVGNYAIG